MRRVCKWALTACGLVSACLVPQAFAAPSEFYSGKTIVLYVGFGPGAGYDLYARVLSQHLGAHLPGHPGVVVENMEGAGSLRLANWLYNAAPRDGTAIGVIGRGTAFDPLFRTQGATFVASKFAWLGSVTNEVSVCVATRGSGIGEFADLRNKLLEVGASGPSADTYQFPSVLNRLLGTQMKIISGYRGGADIELAMERGEIKGRCGWSWSSLEATRAAWVKNGFIKILVQLGLSKSPDLPDVPLITDFATTSEQQSALRVVFARQVMAWPFLAPPDLPPERADALRTAFADTMQDPLFLSDARKAGLEVRPVSGKEFADLVDRVYATQPKNVEEAAAAVE